MSTIIGIDILAGTSSQKLSAISSNRFAAIVMKDEKITETFDSISMKDLVQLCKTHEPEFLGVDNIFELESNSAKVIQFCSQLPPETKIIQVTGAPPDGFESLNRLAKRNNIPYPIGHASPIQSAEIICRLAGKRVGYILMPFEDETEIKISRSKAIGPGGWSQQRYSRKMRGEILNLTRDVEKQLLDHKIDYDLEVRKTEYGYDSANFRVYTSVGEVRKVVKPFKGELSRIIVFPIRKKRLEFIPASGGRKKISSGVSRKSDRGLIVGIDPGPNTGIAVLNFAGKILFNDSLRSVARGDIIRELTLLGDPTLIAADVTPPPDFVIKIAKMLKASLYYPEKLYSADEKSAVVDNFTTTEKIDIKGSHRRDALFAAIKAFNKYRTLFEKVDMELTEVEDVQLRNEVKQMIIKEDMNIQEAIACIKQRQVVVERQEIKRPEEIVLTENEQNLIEKIDALKALSERQTIHIENLEDMNIEVQDLLEKYKRENFELEKNIKKITKQQNQELRRERAIKTRDDELNFLRGRVKELESELTRVKRIITDLKRMIVMGSNRVVVPMKVIFEFSREGIEKTIERMNIEAFDLVLLVDPSGGGQKTAEMLIEREVRAVICKGNNISNQAMEAFLQANVPVLFQMPIRQIDDIAVVYYDELEQAISAWEEQRQKILGEKTERQLGSLISEYQEQRKKELALVYQQERKDRKEKDIPRRPIRTIETKEVKEE
ncbi:MAG: DUF460 domain-containing protein [Candidatus Heimdallarchaeota archaeon]|nr:DUF460 domain-containing protein [Candidatus Heimdallarchaeota archaeon]